MHAASSIDCALTYEDGLSGHVTSHTRTRREHMWVLPKTWMPHSLQVVMRFTPNHPVLQAMHEVDEHVGATFVRGHSRQEPRSSCSPSLLGSPRCTVPGCTSSGSRSGQHRPVCPWRRSGSRCLSLHVLGSRWDKRRLVFHRAFVGCSDHVCVLVGHVPLLL